MTSKNMKQVNPNRSIPRHVVFLVLVCSLLTFAANAQCVSSQAKKAKEPSQSPLNAALQKSFGSTVEAVTTFKPFYLTGDFNGDGAQDALIVVRLKSRASELPKDVKLLNPFARGAEPTFPVDPSANPTLALAIIHGRRTGWQTAPAGKFLLVGESPVLALENDRAISKYPEGQVKLMEIIKRSGRRRRGAFRAPATAKGDSVLLGTEAADSILYWDGKTYRWQETEGGE